jgi:hypothetical protein
MPAPWHDQIVQAVKAACLVSPALAGGNVFDDTLDDDMPEGVSEAIQIGMLDSQPVATAYADLEWQTVVRVSCKARRDVYGANGKPSTALGAAVFARLTADRTLDGLADTVGQPRMSADNSLQHTRIGVLHLDFPVRHRTPRTSIA